MKNKIAKLCLSALLFLIISCKKETSISLVGQWQSVSMYTMQNNGTYNWIPVSSHAQVYIFSREGKFSSYTDVPGRSGGYNYDNASQKLTLYYEPDHYGNLPGTGNLNVEILDRDRLILSYPSSTLKTEYTRIK